METMTTIMQAMGSLPTIDNPVDGIRPDFTIFGSALDSAWKKVFAGFYGAILILVIWRVFWAFGQVSEAKNSHNPHDLETSTAKLKKAIISLVLVVMGVPIVGGLLFALS